MHRFCKPFVKISCQQTISNITSHISNAMWRCKYHISAYLHIFQAQVPSHWAGLYSLCFLHLSFCFCSNLKNVFISVPALTMCRCGGGLLETVWSWPTNPHLWAESSQQVVVSSAEGSQHALQLIPRKAEAGGYFQISMENKEVMLLAVEWYLGTLIKRTEYTILYGLAELSMLDELAYS